MGGETGTGSRHGPSAYPVHSAGPVAKVFHPIYKDRLSIFSGDGQYADNNLRSKLHRSTASGPPHIELSVYSPPDLSRPTFKDATSHKFKPTKVGKSFGPSWSTHWFKVELTVPPNLKDAEHLEFHWNANNEGLVWSKDGVPLQGLTGGGEREEWILPKDFRDGKQHTFYIEMACNSMFGNAPGGDSIQPPDMDKTFGLEKAEIVSVNLQARALFFDFWIIKDAAREFSEQGWQQHKALQVCNSIMDCFAVGNGSDDSIAECRKIAQSYLGDKVDSAHVYDDGPDVLVSGIGHCHIDTCWLWPWAETKRKIARSWSNQCDLMERYPEHRFCCSQAQQFKWLETYYPSLFDRVKTKVKEGTFQPIGGSWVEHDTNLPSGESLVRQFLYGQRYFQSRFGQRSTTFWLPDTFGYSSQLPQLCRLAGMTRFFTQKLSWNNINSFPHTTFNWVALDGSQVLCHMTPAETYTAEAHFGDVQRSMTQHKSMDQDPTSLLVFGKGDGGGGPTWEHMEKLRRCRGLSDKIGLLPRVKMGDSVDDFFARLEKRAQNGLQFVTWYGELYFELHRGTYTTQANNKRNNRKAEIMLHDVELLATMASIKHLTHGTSSSYSYPKKDIDEMWENVLLCQFHDCLPGSSIEMCYDDSDKLYAKVFKTADKLLLNALDVLGFNDVESGDGELLKINTLPWGVSECVELPPLVNPSAATLPQISVPCRGVSLLSLAEDLPPACYAEASDDGKNSFTLACQDMWVTIEDGVITSIFDRHARYEIIPPKAKANQFVLFDDKPLYWQAWDVEVYHLGSRQELVPFKAYIGEKSGLRASVIVETRISDRSSIKTEIILHAVSPYAEASCYPLPDARVKPLVEIKTQVKWHEDKKFLKVEFPVDVLSSEASYETQFGIVRRPTHYNTTWDMAKFEVCCHKWADLSEATYGVSILNDCKYGFATQGRVMRLSLLRAPKAPDAHADMGTHQFRYAIMPHDGPLGSQTVRAARSFNAPLASSKSLALPFTPSDLYLRTHTNALDAGFLLGSIRMTEESSPAIIIDSIKRGEDDEDVGTDESSRHKGMKSIIVRLYESLGGRCRGWLECGGLLVRSARKCNLLEDDDKEALHLADKTQLEIELRPFEVQTYRLILETDAAVHAKHFEHESQVYAEEQKRWMVQHSDRMRK